jgi:hypothetical protein
MADVIELGKFAGMARTSSGTAPMNVQPSQDSRWSRSSDLDGSSQEFLSAAAVRKLDDESPIGRVLELIELTLQRLETCMQYLGQKEMFSGDDELMACKRLFSEMLMFRDVNDTIGLIAWTAYQASQVTAITDAPMLPEVLHRVLTRLWASPFMRFEEACLLAEEIESAVLIAPAAGYIEVSEELLTEQVQD